MSYPAYPASWYYRRDEQGVTRWYTLDYANKEREIVAEEIGSYNEWRSRVNNPALTDPPGFIGQEIEISEYSGVGVEELSAKAGSGPRALTLSDSTLSGPESESEVIEPLETEAEWVVWAAIIVSGLIIAGSLLALFLPSSPAYVLNNDNSTEDSEDSDEEKEEDQDEDEESPNAEDAFALSSNHFWSVYETLEHAGPENSWKSSSEACYTTQNNEFRDRIGQIANASQEVDFIVQTEAEQVNNGRSTLENLLGGLQLALPVSKDLYFSGPAGPALSHSFQLAVTNPAVGAGTETTNTMHENSKKHGQNLIAVAQQYDEALSSLCAADSAAEPDQPVG